MHKSCSGADSLECKLRQESGVSSGNTALRHAAVGAVSHGCQLGSLVTGLCDLDRAASPDGALSTAHPAAARVVDYGVELGAGISWRVSAGRLATHWRGHDVANVFKSDFLSCHCATGNLPLSALP